MLKQMFVGFIRIHILYHASQAPIYGTEIIRELEKHGYKLSPGTVYPILHKMKKENYLAASKQNVQGRIRIYYEITEKGREVLKESKEKLRELVKEILE